MTNSNIQPIKILLVEDNPGDIRLTKEALKDSKIHNTLEVVEDGDDALDYLYQRGKYKDATRPDLVLLDLDLPNTSGREVLESAKKDPSLKRIPFVVLTISKSDQDVLNSYDMQANAYINKPLDLDQFIRVIHSIEDFWLTIVKLPSGSE